jgi:Zn-dependent protease
VAVLVVGPHASARVGFGDAAVLVVGRLVLARLGHITEAAEVGTSAEAAAGTGEDDDPDLGIGVGLGHAPAVLVLHATGPRVEPVGPVQSDDGHAVVHLVDRDLQFGSVSHLSTRGISSGRRTMAASGLTS